MGNNRTNGIRLYYIYNKGINKMITINEKDKLKAMSLLARAFSYSQNHKSCMMRFVSDVEGKRGGRLYVCNKCWGDFQPKDVQVDHILPVVPLDIKKKDIHLWLYIEHLYCGQDNLQVLCKDCHKKKSKEENSIRRKLRA